MFGAYFVLKNKLTCLKNKITKLILQGVFIYF